MKLQIIQQKALPNASWAKIVVSMVAAHGDSKPHAWFYVPCKNYNTEANFIIPSRNQTRQAVSHEYRHECYEYRI